MNHKQVVQQLLDRAQVQINGNEPGDILVHNDGFYNRVLAQGSLGLGESYMEAVSYTHLTLPTIYSV